MIYTCVIVRVSVCIPYITGDFFPMCPLTSPSVSSAYCLFLCFSLTPFRLSAFLFVFMSVCISLSLCYMASLSSFIVLIDYASLYLSIYRCFMASLSSFIWLIDYASLSIAVIWPVCPHLLYLLTMHLSLSLSITVIWPVCPHLFY